MYMQNQSVPWKGRRKKRYSELNLAHKLKKQQQILPPLYIRQNFHSFVVSFFSLFVCLLLTPKTSKCYCMTPTGKNHKVPNDRLLFRYPFHPSVTAVARKRSWSFCKKYWWQVTAKQACTLCMWLCMKWHGAWLYDVHRTCAETAAVSCGTSHASAVSTPLQWIFKNALWKLVTYVELHARAMSLLKSGE